MLLQIAVNLANDYFDAKNEIDSEERLGPVRVTQAGLIPSSQVRAAMIVTLGAAALVFAYLTMVGGSVVFWVGVASILCALAYSGGPFPIASHGLGELFVLIFFGPVAVCTTYYVQAGGVTSMVVLASLVPGLLITAIMVINNLRDIPTDRVSGKMTLPVRLGERNTRLLYAALAVLAVLAVIGFAALTTWWALLALLGALLLIEPMRRVLGGADGRGLIPVIQSTGVAEIGIGVGLLVGTYLA